LSDGRGLNFVDAKRQKVGVAAGVTKWPGWDLSLPEKNKIKKSWNKIEHWYYLKVSKSQKQILSSHTPQKNQRNFSHFFGLASKKLSKQKIKAQKY
jgi:hypothetical protein